MKNIYKSLITDMDFLAAALSQVRVSVWHVLGDREQLIDYGGPVEEYSPVSIKIMGKRYFRNMFEFRVQK
ncbi:MULTISPECIES: hypothetical protein [Paenibacillus]|uniref:Uncharacterized protein n=1 Tax=Paenibacillus pabuli TaxID=1472 RepID=A0A855Y676_9BACL|nr:MULTISPECIES: hypothetical protein [Paenibacillus]PWW37414.1 hypothetical protein DET56_109301 [Paenibacillus pabuli]PXW05556.1 hypothetical protein DEU73_108300 [Paenibacillus taichungensis]